MIYAVNNGCEHDDEAIYFIETDLTPPELATLIEIEHGPADQQVHRWTKIARAGSAELHVPTAYAHEIPYLLFIADVSEWAPDLEDGGFHGGISAVRLTKTPRGEIYWLAHESTARLEQLVKAERTRATTDQADKAAGHPRAMGASHPKWSPFEPIRAELEWRERGKTCGCGIHHTARAWLELDQARFQWCPEDDEDGPELLECRHCSCGSTIARLHRLPFKWRPPIAAAALPEVPPFTAAQRELEQHRQRVEQLAGAGFTRAAIDAAMAASGARVARLEEGTVEGMTPRAGDRHVLIVLAPARVPHDSPLNHVEWRNAVRWFRANAPLGVVVEVHNVGRQWSNASTPIPLPPPRSPV